MKTIILLISSIVLISCSKNNFEYQLNKTADLNSYHFYNFKSNLNNKLSSKDSIKLFKDLEKNFNGLGWEKSNNPEVEVIINFNQIKNKELEKLNIGLGNQGGSFALGGLENNPIEHIVYQNIFQLILKDKAKNTVLFNSNYEDKSKLKPSGNKSVFFDEAFLKIFKKIPIYRLTH